MPRASTKGRRPVATWRRPRASLEKAATSAEDGADMMLRMSRYKKLKNTTPADPRGATPADPPWRHACRPLYHVVPGLWRFRWRGPLQSADPATETATNRPRRCHAAYILLIVNGLRSRPMHPNSNWKMDCDRQDVCKRMQHVR
eukprot:COSAG02_NODE_2150_length_9660_cov_45.377889_13_plen_144_part_00